MPAAASTTPPAPPRAPGKAPGGRRRVWPWLAAGLPLGWLAQRLAAAFPQTCDRIYARTLFPAIRKGTQALSSHSPVSLAEAILLLAGTLITALAARGLYRAARRRATWREVLLAGATRGAAGAGCAYALFLIMWGFNYAAPPLAERLELQPRVSTAAELATLCNELSDRARLEREGLGEDQAGVFRRQSAHSALASEVGAALRAAATRHPSLAGLAGADPLLRFPWSSPLLSRLGITGIWSPYTAEAHVNAHVPDAVLPFTACHEAAHARAFAREDEASFVAYLVGRRAPSRELRYSANLCALRLALAQLSRVQPDLAREILDRIAAGPRRDIDDLDAYWRAQRSWIMSLARVTNHAYLRTQGDERGVRSYGRMVDLLLAERRVRGSEL